MRMNRHTVENADYGRARQLRKSASGIEQKVWFALREACGAKDFSFRRQHPIHPYIADFACLKARLLIEIDGSSHDMRQGYDAARDAYLRQKGYSVMRIGNRDVTENLQGVVAAIIAETETQLQKLSPNTARQGANGTPPHLTSPSRGEESGSEILRDSVQETMDSRTTRSPKTAIVPPPLRGRLGGGALRNPNPSGEKDSSAPPAHETARQRANGTPPHLTSPSRGEESGSGILKGTGS